MYPLIPAELTQNVLQMLVYFVTLLGTVLGFVLCSRG